MRPCVSTTLPALTTAAGVTTRGRRPASTRTIGVHSKMRTPRSSSTRRSSRASLAGCSTVRSGVIDAADEARRVGDAPRLGGVHPPQPVGVAVPLEQAEGLLVGPGLPLAGPGVQDALVPGVDAGVVARDPSVQLVDHVREGGGVGHTALFPERRAQAREAGPRGREEAAVGAAAPGADDVRLDEDDVEIRVALVQLIGGPQAGEAAADDADVGGHLAGRRRARSPGSARSASCSHQLRAPTAGTAGRPPPESVLPCSSPPSVHRASEPWMRQ